METLLANRYALETEIAAGAAGTVWRARDTRTGQLVAVKVLRHDAAADADVVKAFRDEAGVLSEVDHPGVVRPRDFVAADGQLALVMDLVEGTDLRHRVRADGPLPPADAARMLAEVADALGAVHAAGIVHGDVKPGNILVPHDGGPARLADFGVARRVQSGESATHGTPEYLAPEVVAGNTPTLPADVYALGIVLYEMVSGRSPFRGGPVHEVLRRQQDSVAVQPPGMPDQVWQVITRCLERDPRIRPSAAELAASLRELRPTLTGMSAAFPVPEHVSTHRPRLVEEPVTPVPAPVSPAPVPISASPVSVFPGMSGPVSPAVIGPVSPAPGAAGPAGGPAQPHPYPNVAHHVPATAPGGPGAPGPVNPWEAPADNNQPDFITAVLAAPAGTPVSPATAAKRRRGGWVAGVVGATAAAVLIGFVAILLLVDGGSEPTNAKNPPAASDEHDEAQPPAPSPSPSPSREPSPSPQPEESAPPSQPAPPQDPGDDDPEDDGDDDPNPDPPAPTNQMPTLPTKPSFPR